MKQFTNLIVLDASGSMGSKIDEVIGGLKQLFASIVEEKAKYPDTNVTTIVTDFSGARDFRVLINSTNLNDLTAEVAESYKVRGLTALYDAMGLSFRLVPENQDGVFVTVITDGEENDSKEFNAQDIKTLIADSRAKNWVISFMGTTEDSIKNAVNLGVSRGNTVQFENNSRGVAYAAGAMKLSRSAHYTSVVTGVALDMENLVTDALNVDENFNGVVQNAVGTTSVTIDVNNPDISDNDIISNAVSNDTFIIDANNSILSNE